MLLNFCLYEWGGEGFALRREGAISFRSCEKKWQKKSRPKRAANAPLFGNTQQTDAKNAGILIHFRINLCAPASLALLRKNL